MRGIYEDKQLGLRWPSRCRGDRGKVGQEENKNVGGGGGGGGGESDIRALATHEHCGVEVTKLSTNKQHLRLPPLLLLSIFMILLFQRHP